MAGVTHVPQEHWLPDQEKLPTLVEHFGQCTLPSTAGSQEGQSSKNKTAHALESTLLSFVPLEEGFLP